MVLADVRRFSGWATFEATRREIVELSIKTLSPPS
jgi:hypothetical protein